MIDELAKPFILTPSEGARLMGGRAVTVRRKMYPQPVRVTARDIGLGTVAGGVAIHVPTGWSWKSSYQADSHRPGKKTTFFRDIAEHQANPRAMESVWIQEPWRIENCGSKVAVDKRCWPEGFPIDRVRYGRGFGSEDRKAKTMPRWASRQVAVVVKVEVLCDTEGVWWWHWTLVNPGLPGERDER